MVFVENEIVKLFDKKFRPVVLLVYAFYISLP